MADLDATPRRLVLDTDWISAIAMAGLFVIGILFTLGTLVKILRNAPPSVQVSWETWLLAGMCLWLLLSIADRHVRIVAVVLAVGPVSKILLWLLGSSVGIRIMNEAIIRVFDEFLYLGGCIYVCWWFYTKVRRHA